MTSDDLLRAIQSLNAEDAFRPRLDPTQWRSFLQFLTRHEIRSGELLLKQGEFDRTVYFIGHGSVQMFGSPAAPGAGRLTILRPGAICGEAGLFLDASRTANAEAMTTCVVWALRLPRFEELSARVPQIAIEVLRAAGAVLALRSRAGTVR